MYIAFKWLTGLTFTMWITVCGIDMLFKQNIEFKQRGFNNKIAVIGRNITIPVERKMELQSLRYYNKRIGDKPQSVAFLHCFMFLAGALVVSLYNRKNEIILFTKGKISEIDTKTIVDRLQLLQEYLKITANRTCVFTINYGKSIWVHINNEMIKLRNKICALLIRKELQKPKINIILLKKLQEIGQERKNLGQLLIAAIHENKNIRIQYQLESMAKNRLVRHIENTQKLIKENRSKYVSFEQLYLVTHQENLFLKSRMKKVIKEKEEAENNLLKLMNEVYKSKNKDIKAFCNRLLVRTTDNFLKSDVCAEIQSFLAKSQTSVTTASNWQLSEQPDIKVNSTSSWPRCANPRFAEIIQDDVLVPLVSDAPKLKGLPGEYVWTVKDKDGLIEKLYEYDYESDLDDGDTIRRIRQYSVYFDKDCLLDFSNSRTVINETRTEAPPLEYQCTDVDYPVTGQGFVTGSEAFQKFMQVNRNIISNSTPRLPGPPLLSS